MKGNLSPCVYLSRNYHAFRLTLNCQLFFYIYIYTFSFLIKFLADNTKRSSIYILHAMDFLNVIFIFVTMIGCDALRSNVDPLPTPADKLSLLQREDLRFFLGLTSRGENRNFLPIESRQYKCRILTTL